MSAPDPEDRGRGQEELYLQTAQEPLLEREPAGFSQKQKQTVLRARRQFIEAQAEYIEKIRDHLTLHEEFEHSSGTEAFAELVGDT